MGSPRIRAGQQGFTLLEVLVAIMILGLSLGAILYQFALASRAGSASYDSTRAVMHAREKLEELKTMPRLGESSAGGSFDDGFEWETRVQLYGYDEVEDQSVFEGMRYETYHLSALVTWRYGSRARQVELETLRTVRKREWGQAGDGSGFSSE
ncbi:MAG: type II secretion system protein [Deltaproteobacteria bacterium]|nr:type II secretion system protein [Deltaproteobacteria bacterium]